MTFKRLTDAIITRYHGALALAVTVASFVFGILLASAWEGFGEGIHGVLSWLLDAYSYLAPLAIFLVMTPALSRLFYGTRGWRFGTYAIGWLCVRKLAACLYAIVATTLVFRLPLTSPMEPDLMREVARSLSLLGRMFLKSPYVLAVWISLLVAAVSYRKLAVARFQEGGVRWVENIGPYFLLVGPLFMLAFGAYVHTLPHHLPRLGADAQAAALPVTFLAIALDPRTSGGMIGVYLVGSLVIGFCCLLWHGSLLVQAKLQVPKFSIRVYFTKYWLRVYPLLWATSSETLAMPLNLSLVREHFADIREEVRRFVVGLGSYLNINGTIICVFLMIGVVMKLLGLPLSAVELLRTLPVVYLISLGVPGIPGELALFAGPLATILGVQGSHWQPFLTLYLGLQLGLPDSFRTGSNSTDDCVAAIILNRVYEEKFRN